MNNTIPEITDPMGRHWKQPSKDEILIDDTHALMPQNVFERLSDYSCTMPSGVYAGKMWRRRHDFYDPSKGWMLCWFGHDPEPGFCSNNFRDILTT